MKEIEIKAKLKNKKEVMEKLESLGCTFEPMITQNDSVYVENTGSLAEFRTNKVFLRIRNKNNQKILFTLKKRMKNDLDALEHETEIGSKEEMENALFLMGYKEAIKINKTRIITHYNGCEICIDEVEDLGSYIEMEKLAEDADSEKIQDELFEFFLTLGIQREDREVSGYDILMFEKKSANK